MVRSPLERYLDFQLALLNEEARVTDLSYKDSTKFPENGKTKGHISIVETDGNKTYGLTEKGISCCEYWLTLRKKFEEKIISSIHDLDSEPFEDMVDFQLLENEEFRQACELYPFYQVRKQRKFTRKSFELNIDFLRLLYQYYLRGKPPNTSEITKNINIPYKTLRDLRKSTEEAELIRVDEYPGTGRYGKELRFSLEPRGVSYIKSYEGFLLMFDLNSFLRTQLELLVLGNNQNYSSNR